MSVYVILTKECERSIHREGRVHNTTIAFPGAAGVNLYVSANEGPFEGLLGTVYRQLTLHFIGLLLPFVMTT